MFREIVNRKIFICVTVLMVYRRMKEIFLYLFEAVGIFTGQADFFSRSAKNFSEAGMAIIVIMMAYLSRVALIACPSVKSGIILNMENRKMTASRIMFP